MNHWQPLFITPDDAEQLREQLTVESLMGRVLHRQIAELEGFMALPVVIPRQGEAGGPEHARHKQNYHFINLAGRLSLICQRQAYRDFALQLLNGYADIYPNLGRAVSKDSNAPGRLFHQTLNENMWLLYAVEGYHCIQPSLSAAECQKIENQLFRVMIDDALTLHAKDFDIVHNHGIWSVAAAAICGYVLGDQRLVDKALYGLKGDSESGGFFAQLSQLFSPDGYYIEGPYYQRFALRPLLLLAEAIHRRQPELAIYQFRDQVVRKTCEALMQVAFPDGTLPALNDSSKTINLRDDGAVVAASICFSRYGGNPQWIAAAHWQDSLWVSAAGLALSNAAQHTPAQLMNWGSLTLSDGPQGQQGEVAILRQPKQNGELTMALLWYGQHGSIPRLHSALNHGHFDGLHLSLFSHGRETLRDYGFGRWVNVEPKFGGRYIAENNSYCKQTVAHNTLVVDQQSQNFGQSAEAEKRHGERHFFVSEHPAGQGMSARLRDYYPGVTLQRTVLMLNFAEFENPLLVDVMRVSSQQPHQYDYCLHHLGQLVRSDSPLRVAEQLKPLGANHGYQHLWDCARAEVTPQNSILYSWLDGHGYTSLISALPLGGELIVARSGASDPHFNLRNEPALLLRQQGSDAIFANVIESHGYFDEATETSRDARGKVSRVEVLSQDFASSELLIHVVDGRRLRVTINNQQQPVRGMEFSATWQG